jgi:hypothetical protein
VPSSVKEAPAPALKVKPVPAPTAPLQQALNLFNGQKQVQRAMEPPKKTRKRLQKSHQKTRKQLWTKLLKNPEQKKIENDGDNANGDQPGIIPPGNSGTPGKGNGSNISEEDDGENGEYTIDNRWKKFYKLLDKLKDIPVPINDNMYYFEIFIHQNNDELHDWKNMYANLSHLCKENISNQEIQNQIQIILHDTNEELVEKERVAEAAKIGHVAEARAAEAKTPVAKTPVAEVPVAKTPVAEAKVAKAPVAKTPVAEDSKKMEEAPVAAAEEEKEEDISEQINTFITNKFQNSGEFLQQIKDLKLVDKKRDFDKKFKKIIKTYITENEMLNRTERTELIAYMEKWREKQEFPLVVEMEEEEKEEEVAPKDVEMEENTPSTKEKKTIIDILDKCNNELFRNKFQNFVNLTLQANEYQDEFDTLKKRIERFFNLQRISQKDENKLRSLLYLKKTEYDRKFLQEENKMEIPQIAPQEKGLSKSLSSKNEMKIPQEIRILITNNFGNYAVKLENKIKDLRKESDKTEYGKKLNKIKKIITENRALSKEDKDKLINYMVKLNKKNQTEIIPQMAPFVPNAQKGQEVGLPSTNEMQLQQEEEFQIDEEIMNILTTSKCLEFENKFKHFYKENNVKKTDLVNSIQKETKLSQDQKQILLDYVNKLEKEKEDKRIAGPDNKGIPLVGGPDVIGDAQKQPEKGMEVVEKKDPNEPNGNIKRGLNGNGEDNAIIKRRGIIVDAQNQPVNPGNGTPLVGGPNVEIIGDAQKQPSQIMDQVGGPDAGIMVVADPNLTGTPLVGGPDVGDAQKQPGEGEVDAMVVANGTPPILGKRERSGKEDESEKQPGNPGKEPAPIMDQVLALVQGNPGLVQRPRIEHGRILKPGIKPKTKDVERKPNKLLEQRRQIIENKEILDLRNKIRPRINEFEENVTILNKYIKNNEIEQQKDQFLEFINQNMEDATKSKLTSTYANLREIVKNVKIPKQYKTSLSTRKEILKILKETYEDMEKVLEEDNDQVIEETRIVVKPKEPTKEPTKEQKKKIQEDRATRVQLFQEILDKLKNKKIVKLEIQKHEKEFIEYFNTFTTKEKLTKNGLVKNVLSDETNNKLKDLQEYIKKTKHQIQRKNIQLDIEDDFKILDGIIRIPILKDFADEQMEQEMEENDAIEEQEQEQEQQLIVAPPRKEEPSIIDQRIQYFGNLIFDLDAQDPIKQNENEILSFLKQEFNPGENIENVFESLYRKVSESEDEHVKKEVHLLLQQTLYELNPQLQQMEEERRQVREKLQSIQTAFQKEIRNFSEEFPHPTEFEDFFNFASDNFLMDFENLEKKLEPYLFLAKGKKLKKLLIEMNKFYKKDLDILLETQIPTIKKLFFDFIIERQSQKDQVDIVLPFLKEEIERSEELNLPTKTYLLNLFNFAREKYNQEIPLENALIQYNAKKAYPNYFPDKKQTEEEKLQDAFLKVYGENNLETVFSKEMKNTFWNFLNKKSTDFEKDFTYLNQKVLEINGSKINSGRVFEFDLYKILVDMRTLYLQEQEQAVQEDKLPSSRRRKELKKGDTRVKVLKDEKKNANKKENHRYTRKTNHRKKPVENEKYILSTFNSIYETEKLNEFFSKEETKLFIDFFTKKSSDYDQDKVQLEHYIHAIPNPNNDQKRRLNINQLRHLVKLAENRYYNKDKSSLRVRPEEGAIQLYTPPNQEGAITPPNQEGAIQVYTHPNQEGVIQLYEPNPVERFMYLIDESDRQEFLKFFDDDEKIIENKNYELTDKLSKLKTNISKNTSLTRDKKMQINIDIDKLIEMIKEKTILNNAEIKRARDLGNLNDILISAERKVGLKRKPTQQRSDDKEYVKNGQHKEDDESISI